MGKVKNTVEKVQKKSFSKLVRRQSKEPQTYLAPDKLVVLVTIVNRRKGEYFLDLLQSFNSNLQMSFAAYGTASKALGLLAPETEKTVLFSVLTRENAKLALSTLEEKFNSIRHGKGVAFTIPMTSTIGVSVYRFLCNKE